MELAAILLPTAGAIAALGIILVAVRKTTSFFRRVVHLFDEILGREAHDGLPPSPGLSSRMASIEAELRPNGGASMRDQLNRMEIWQIQHSGIHKDIEARHNHPSN